VGASQANRPRRLRLLDDACVGLLAFIAFRATSGTRSGFWQGTRLGEWIATAQQSELPGVTGFARGPISDLDAVTAGLTLRHSSGPVERNVNRIKMIARQTYGRAGFDLLRKRVMLAS
jgi:hypothetical protein